MASRESTVVNKLGWDLLPMDAVEEIVKVLTLGANKYSPNNWRAAPHFKPSQLVASAFRHIVARYWHGEMRDGETGLLHTAHAACNLIFAIYYDQYDLYSKEPDTIVVSGEVSAIVAEGRIARFEKSEAQDELEGLIVKARVDLAAAEAQREKTPLEVAQEALQKRKRELGIDTVYATQTMPEQSMLTRSVSEMARLDDLDDPDE